MKGDITEYARLGLVHHMLYPGCVEDGDLHAETLAEFTRRDDIETFDCCLPYGEDRREALIPLIRDCGREKVFAAHLFPLRKISFASPSASEQGIIRMVIKDMVECAAAVGASGFIFASGGPSPERATQAHREAFRDFCEWLCAELKPHGITAMLEPFDTDVDKRFLYGPTRMCAALIESLAPQVDNLGIELDMAHVPLMRESFDAAVSAAAPHLKRVHLGNCVLKDPSHPLYGDVHPPIGIDGGEIDVPELAAILRCLLDVGYLNRENRGALLLEMIPWPGKTVGETVADGFDRLRRAWALV